MPTTTIRYDESVRDAALPILDSMGISLNNYFNIALRQLVLQNRIPFTIYGAPAGQKAIPTMKVENGRLVAPADWYDEDDD